MGKGKSWCVEWCFAVDFPSIKVTVNAVLALTTVLIALIYDSLPEMEGTLQNVYGNVCGHGNGNGRGNGSANNTDIQEWGWRKKACDVMKAARKCETYRNYLRDPLTLAFHLRKQQPANLENSQIKWGKPEMDTFKEPNVNRILILEVSLRTMMSRNKQRTNNRKRCFLN